MFTPGWKYSDWEMRGAPLRIEIGPKDIAKNQVVIVRRDNRQKEFVPINEASSRVRETLDSLQKDMFQRAKQHLESHIFKIDTYTEFREAMENTKGFILSFWCGSPDCEAKVKEELAATIRIIPTDQPLTKKPCVVCGTDGKVQVYFAKAY